MSENRSSVPGGSDRLARRRQLRRRRALVALGILFILACGALVYGLRQAPVRISRIVVYGADQSLADVARSAMQGSFLGIPLDSTFLVPSSRIRARIMADHADIAAVSLFHNGLTGLSIKVDYRVPIARWCGLSPSGPEVDEYCYVFDANALIFAAAATSMQTINPFSLYAPLVGGTLEPLRATIERAEKLPAVFNFARQLVTFGISVTKVVFRDDEIDLHLTSGTRITYVLGNEQNAFTALASGRNNMNLADGSIDYVDLRFSGKVYVKKKGEN